MAVGNLRNVDKSVNTVDNVCERSEGGKTDNLGLNNRADRIIPLEDFPGVVLNSLVAERNLSVLPVKSLDIYLDNVALFDNFGRVLDTLPGKL